MPWKPRSHSQRQGRQAKDRVYNRQRAALLAYMVWWHDHLEDMDALRVGILA